MTFKPRSHTFGSALTRLAMACAALALTTASAHARCIESRLENFLESRFFSLPAERKISRYADSLFYYYDNRDISREQVLDKMIAWEERWPDRIYKFMFINDFETAEDDRACRVSFRYKFIAYSYERDKLSAGIGETTLVLADLEDSDRMRIVAENGGVLCRGIKSFQRGRC